MFIETVGRIFGLDGIGNRVTQSTVARGREDPSGTELCLGHPTLLLILSLYIIFGGVGGTIKKTSLSTVARGREDRSGTELCLGHPALLFIMSLYIIFRGVGRTIKKRN